jgi:ParB family chromosome partitioning protein
MEDSELQAMAATTRERGCLQPIRVRATDTGDFALIAGERRYRAAALADLNALPAVVLTAGAGDEGEHRDLLTDAMIENELRGDLDADPSTPSHPRNSPLASWDQRATTA